MAINIIVAMDRNRLVGVNNRLPWKLPSDLAYFKRVTEHNIVCMGRKTFESIGKALPNRTNIVLSKQFISGENDSDFFLNSIDEVLEFYETSYEDDMFIIGGSNVYSQFLPYAENLFITEIDHEFEGDSYFPEYDKNDWILIGQQQSAKDEKNPYDHSFKIFTRRLTDES